MTSHVTEYVVWDGTRAVAAMNDQSEAQHQADALKIAGNPAAAVWQQRTCTWTGTILRGSPAHLDALDVSTEKLTDLRRRLGAIADLHRPLDKGALCSCCSEPWPCVTRRMTDAP